jgi:hypothetical protein
VWSNLIKRSDAAKLTMGLKVRKVFSHFKARRSKRYSMRARALSKVLAKKAGAFLLDLMKITGAMPLRGWPCWNSPSGRNGLGSGERSYGGAAPGDRGHHRQDGIRTAYLWPETARLQLNERHQAQSKWPRTNASSHSSSAVLNTPAKDIYPNFRLLF